MSKVVAPVLLGLFLITAPFLLAQALNDDSNGVDNNDDIWIKDCMGREVPAGSIHYISILLLQCHSAMNIASGTL